MQLPPAGMGNLTCAKRRPQENIAELGPSRPVGRRPRIPGLVDFGENRVQEANAKRPALSDLTVTWHMVGHLQSNKAKLARELFHVVHSVDSLRLAQKLDQAAVCADDKLPVLLQVNLGDELTKSGAREEEISQLAEQVGRLKTLE